MPSICMLTFSPPLTVNSEAGLGGPLFKSLGRLSPPYCTGMSSGLTNLNQETPNPVSSDQLEMTKISKFRCQQTQTHLNKLSK